jgi:uncharacterized membrane protein YgdD (TMEM256/DUF423 family)
MVWFVCSLLVYRLKRRAGGIGSDCKPQEGIYDLTRTDRTLMTDGERPSSSIPHAKLKKFMQILPLIASIIGASGVAMGAFGAHALKSSLASREMTAVWETACLYHLVHALAVLIVVLLPASSYPSLRLPMLRRAAWCWVAGVVLFSGSLYALALGGPGWLGPVTPLGGLAFIAGWVLVSFARLPAEDNRREKA